MCWDIVKCPQKGTVYPPQLIALIFLALGGKGPVLLPPQVASICWHQLQSHGCISAKAQELDEVGYEPGHSLFVIHIPQQQLMLVFDHFSGPANTSQKPKALGTTCM